MGATHEAAVRLPRSAGRGVTQLWVAWRGSHGRRRHSDYRRRLAVCENFGMTMKRRATIALFPENKNELKESLFERNSLVS